MQGLEFRKNKNGFAVARVHYTADPEKTTDKWKAQSMAGMPEWSWRKEYEMDPYAASGRLAFPDLALWKKHIHLPLLKVVKDGIIPHWWPRYAGFDWGRRNPTAIEMATVSPDGTLIFFYEIYQREMSLQNTHTKISAHPDWERLLRTGFVAADPSIFSMTTIGGGVRKGDEEKAISDILIEMGWPVIPGQRGDNVTFVQELHKAWANLDNPKIIITQGCPKLWWELEHLRHQELNVGMFHKKNSPEKIVEKDDHAFHAMKYISRLHPPAPGLEDERPYMTMEEKIQSPELKREPEIVEDTYLGTLA